MTIQELKKRGITPLLTRSGVSLFFDIFSTRGGEWKPTYKKDIRVAAEDIAIYELLEFSFSS